MVEPEQTGPVLAEFGDAGPPTLGIFVSTTVAVRVPGPDDLPPLLVRVHPSGGLQLRVDQVTFDGPFQLVRLRDGAPSDAIAALGPARRGPCKVVTFWEGRYQSVGATILGSTSSGFVVSELHATLPIARSSVVVADDLVVGLVEQDTGREVQCVPTADLRLRLSKLSWGRSDSSGVEALFAAANQLSPDGIAAPEHVLVAALQWATTSRGDDSVTALLDVVRRRRPDLDVRALAMIVNATEGNGWRSEPGREIAMGVGDGSVGIRHVLVDALHWRPLDDRLLAALGAPQLDLRDDLVETYARLHPGEWWSELRVRPAWTRSEAPQRELAGHIDTDLVTSRGTTPLVDRLGVQDYVTMLAGLIARRDTALPISIGLFGQWGSGKSYFMRLLQQTIDQLAGQAGNCGKVKHIWFNAWHYADANLWASLVVEVFDELAGGTGVEPEVEREALVAELTSCQERRDALTAERDRASTAVEELTTSLEEARQRADQADSALDGLKAAAAVAVDDEGVRSAVAALRDSMRQAGLTLPDGATPTQLIDGVRQRAGRARTVGTVLRQRWRYLPWAVVAIALAVAAVWVTDEVLPTVVAFAAPVLAGFGQAAVTARRIVDSVLDKADALADTARSVEERARAEREADIAREAARLAAALQEQVALEAELRAAAAAVVEVEERLLALAPGRQLSAFIDSRSTSDDYRKQLGVVSLVRQDFEDLVALLQARQQDATSDTVERIVLYIDDLDRCPPDRVVEVLEAVHLALAMELFVVVVGVDPRWLMRSLAVKYRELIGAGTDDEWTELPRDYAEKIFQIPFVLPPMGADGLAYLLTGLRRVSEPPPSPGEVTGTMEADVSFEAIAGDASAIPAEQGSYIEGALTESPVELVDLTDAEIAYLGALQPLLPTPRLGKRMANIYRMLRSTRDLSDSSQFLGPDGRGEFTAVAELLAIVASHPDLYAELCWGPPAGLSLLARDPSERWTDVLGELVTGIDEVRWRPVVEPLLAPVISLLRPADADLTAYQRWAPRVARFSFDLSDDRLVT